MGRRQAHLSESTYFILAVLFEQPTHGYGIIKRAAQLSDDRVRLAVGTLYTALGRLAEDGLIQVDREETVAGRPRRYFRITDQGRRVATAEAARMRQAAEVITHPRTRRTALT